jgi:hypothetical protein
MIIDFAKTTIRLWMDVPGMPPLWKCAAVAWCICRTPKTVKIGSINIDELVELEDAQPVKMYWIG